MDTDQKAVIEKIKKVLALAQSNSEAEAETAMRMAHDLLKKYNLTMDQVNDIEIDFVNEVAEEGSRARNWKKFLIEAVAKYNFCGAYIHTVQSAGNIRATTKYSLRLVGKEVNVSCSKIMYTYLTDTIDRFAKTHYGEGKESIEAYKVGIAHALSDRLRNLRAYEEANTECRALVLKEDAAVRNFFKKANMTTSKVNTNIKDAYAYQQGRKDGETISLNAQVKGTSEYRQIS